MGAKKVLGLPGDFFESRNEKGHEEFSWPLLSRELVLPATLDLQTCTRTLVGMDKDDVAGK